MASQSLFSQTASALPSRDEGDSDHPLPKKRSIPPRLLAAAILTPVAVLVGAIIGYILWCRRVHGQPQVNAGPSRFHRRSGLKTRLRDKALPPLTPLVFPTTPSPTYSPSPRSKRARISDMISKSSFEDSPTSSKFDLENLPLARSPITPDVPGGSGVLSRASSARSSATTQTVRQVRIQDQIDSMTARLVWLTSQQQSDWALGLTDEPPPSYPQSNIEWLSDRSYPNRLLIASYLKGDSEGVTVRPDTV
jgi:hypothetical protein